MGVDEVGPTDREQFPVECAFSPLLRATPGLDDGLLFCTPHLGQRTGQHLRIHPTSDYFMQRRTLQHSCCCTNRTCHLGPTPNVHTQTNLFLGSLL